MQHNYIVKLSLSLSFSYFENRIDSSEGGLACAEFSLIFFGVQIITRKI